MQAAHDNPVPLEPRWADRFALIGLLAAGVVLVVFRLHGFDLPLETDEANYAYIGARLLEGDRLYVDVWDHQPFGVFVLFAGVIRFFGDAPEVFRWMVVGFSLASLSLIFGILCRAAGSGAALFGAMLFALVSSDPGTGGEGCNREIYMNTLILLGWYLATASARRYRLALLGAGVSLAVASAIKTVVAVHWIALVVWVVFFSVRHRKPGERLKNLMLLAVGPLVLWIGSLVYFTVTDRFTEFVDAVFLFNLSYSDTDAGLLMRFVAFFSPQRHPFIFASALPLWLFGGASMVWLCLRVCRAGSARRASATTAPTSSSSDEPNQGSQAALVALLVIASFIAVCLPGRFWPHYYYLMIPPLVLAVSLTVGHMADWLGRRSQSEKPRGRIVAYALAFAVIGGASAWTQYRNYLSQPPLGITIKRYNSRDFWGRAHGRNIKRITEPGDTIFVYSNDASIYYYAERRCASRYTMITGVSAGMAGAERRRHILMQELRARLPRLIVVLFDQQPFPEWKAFLDEYYGQPVGWDFNDITNKPIMCVLVRKDQPVRRIDWNWDRSMISQPQG